MKASNLILGTLLFCAQAPGWAAAGGEATGTRGGGEAIDVNGRPTLRDLVDNSVCDWRSGQEVIGFTPSLQKIFNALNGVHWYYGSLLRRSIVDIKFCFTSGDLIQIDAQDADGLTIVDERGRQAAIRVAGRAYVDAKIFMQMTPDDQAYLVAHEAMHTFLAFNTSARNTKLRSTIKSLQTLVLGGMSADSFKLQIQMNQVDWTVTRFDLLDRAAETIREFHRDDENSRNRASGLIQSPDFAYLVPFLSLYEQQEAKVRVASMVKDVPRAIYQCDGVALANYVYAGLDPFSSFTNRGRGSIGRLKDRREVVLYAYDSPVEQLLRRNCVDTLRTILSVYDSDLNQAIESHGLTSLQIAVLLGQSDAARMLLALPKVDVNAGSAPHRYDIWKNDDFKDYREATGTCYALDFAEKNSELYTLLVQAGGKHSASCDSGLRRSR